MSVDLKQMDLLIDHTRNVQKDLWEIEITEKAVSLKKPKRALGKLGEKTGIKKRGERGSQRAERRGSTPDWWKKLSKDEQQAIHRNPKTTAKVKSYPVRTDTGGGKKDEGGRIARGRLGKRREKKRQAQIITGRKKEGKRERVIQLGKLKKKFKEEKDPKKRESFRKQLQKTTGRRGKEGEKALKKKQKEIKGGAKERRATIEREAEKEEATGKVTRRQAGMKKLKTRIAELEEKKIEELKKAKTFIDSIATNAKHRKKLEAGVTAKLDAQLEKAKRAFEKRGGEVGLTKLQSKQEAFSAIKEGQEERKQAELEAGEEAGVRTKIDKLKASKKQLLDLGIKDVSSITNQINQLEDTLKAETTRGIREQEAREEAAEAIKTKEEERITEEEEAEKEKLKTLLEDPDFSLEEVDRMLAATTQERIGGREKERLKKVANEAASRAGQENKKIENKINTLNSLGLDPAITKNEVRKLNAQTIDINALKEHIKTGGDEAQFLTSRNITGASETQEKPENQALNKIKAGDIDKLLPEDRDLILKTNNESVRREAIDSIRANFTRDPKSWNVLSNENKDFIQDFAETDPTLRRKIDSIVKINEQVEEEDLLRKLRGGKSNEDNPEIVSKLMELQQTILQIPNRNSVQYKLTELQGIVAKEI